RAHGAERGVTGRVEEAHHAALGFHMVGADVLRDAASLMRGDAGLADVVEQRGLAVVDVTHDGHHRRTRHEFAFVIDGLHEVLLHGVGGHQLGLVAHFLHDEGRGVLVQHLIDGGHYAHGHQLFDDLAGLYGQTVGEV